MMHRVSVVLVATLSLAGSAAAQVAYQPYAAPAPTPYGYPMPNGFFQPSEVLGTSPSFVISTNPYAPAVAVVQRCQYPDGWNVTDFDRDVNGIPADVGHTCPAPVLRRTGVHSRY